MKIKKGDTVMVRAGRDRNKTGEVLKVIPTEQRVIVAGVNMVTKHNKPNQMSAGGIENKEASIHISNVGLVDPKTNKASRVGMKLLKDGKKVRITKASGEQID